MTKTTKIIIGVGIAAFAVYAWKTKLFVKPKPVIEEDGLEGGLEGEQPQVERPPVQDTAQLR